jgi:MSHA pilin protein MshD
MCIPDCHHSSHITHHPSPRRSRGLSLVEVIVFIVVVGVAVAGVLAALNVSTRASADPVIQKQALAIAEAVLEEVQLMPFTYCDPDDPQAATAQNAGIGATGCSAAASVENPGPEATPPYGPETRLGATTPFDNVNDYNGFSMGPGIIDLTGAAIAGLGGYTATVSVAGQAFAAVGGGRAIPATNSLLVTVTVTGPGNTTAVLHGYRVRYAPTALP